MLHRTGRFKTAAKTASHETIAALYFMGLTVFFSERQDGLLTGNISTPLLYWQD